MAISVAFRDYLTAHPQDAGAYTALKRQLAKKHPYDMEAYTDGKSEFISDWKVELPFGSERIREHAD